ncbi:MAG: electron transfer flavoprotein subunit alpha/FixB family protein [Pseudomonadota bacterium]
MSNRRILVLVEINGAGVSASSYETMAVGKKLADGINGSLCAVVLTHEMGEIPDQVAHWVDEVLCVDTPALAYFQSDIRADVMQEILRRYETDIILLGHTLDSESLAPKIAARNKTEVMTDCVSLDIADGRLLCTRQVYGGNAIVTFEVDRKPAIATLRPGVVEVGEVPSRKGEIVKLEIDLAQFAERTEIVENVIGESVGLDTADAIVAGGRGIGKAEGINMLRDLAEVLKKHYEKVEIGGSRPATDAGWLPSIRQIGLTGEKVNPELYVAIGISGVSQHLVGMVGSKKIVAINSDPQAAIFKYADYGVVERYEDFVPCLIREISEVP